MSTLGRRLKAARERRGWTMYQLRKHAGLSEGSITRYESGERRPNSETLWKLCEALGVTAEYLLGEEEMPLPQQKPTPELERAVRMMRESVSMRAIQQARAMAAASGADLSASCWAGVLAELDRVTPKN